MKTIERILKLHNTNMIEIDTLERDGYINLICNLDKYVGELVYQFYGFDELKAEKLFKDLKTLGLIHDYEFLKKSGFIWSNYLLARDIFLLFNWALFKNRLYLAFSIFILANKFLKVYYKK